LISMSARCADECSSNDLSLHPPTRQADIREYEILRVRGDLIRYSLTRHRKDRGLLRSFINSLPVVVLLSGATKYIPLSSPRESVSFALYSLLCSLFSLSLSLLERMHSRIIRVILRPPSSSSESISVDFSLTQSTQSVRRVLFRARNTATCE